MSHELTRRNVSAIAKIDFDGLGHAQKIEAIAKAIGYETAAALMSCLKAGETSGTPAPGRKPVRAIIAFGSELCSALSSNEPIRDSSGDLVSGNVEELVFNSEGELKAYAKGVADAEGWMDATFLASEDDEPDHPYFAARADDPEIGFLDWYEQHRLVEEGIEAFLDAAEERDETLCAVRPGYDRQPRVGFQLEHLDTSEHWGDRPSFVILSEDTMLADLKALLRAGEGEKYRLLILRDGDVEEPTFE